MARVCPSCGYRNFANVDTCRKCNKKLPAMCPECSTPISPGANFCIVCGKIFDEKKVDTTAYKTSSISKALIEEKKRLEEQTKPHARHEAKVCPSCIRPISKEARFCIYCGYLFLEPESIIDMEQEREELGEDKTKIPKPQPLTVKAVRPMEDTVVMKKAAMPPPTVAEAKDKKIAKPVSKPTPPAKPLAPLPGKIETKTQVGIKAPPSKEAAKVIELAKPIPAAPVKEEKIVFEMEPKKAPDIVAAKPYEMQKIKVIPEAKPTLKEMIKIPSGPFLFGSGRIEKELKEFYIDRTPVTCEQYKKFVEATNYPPPPDWLGDRYFSGKADHPVTNVSIEDAKAYALWAKKRLPTASEWEKAARGVDGREYPWGNEFDASKANTIESGNGITVSVFAHPEGASAYGCLDMTGNVNEWVENDLKKDRDEQEKFIYKGGSFLDIKELAKTFINFKCSDPTTRAPNLGFRCAADAID